jgi:hypothetical protein
MAPANPPPLPPPGPWPPPGPPAAPWPPAELPPPRPGGAQIWGDPSEVNPPVVAPRTRRLPLAAVLCVLLVVGGGFVLLFFLWLILSHL